MVDSLKNPAARSGAVWGAECGERSGELGKVVLKVWVVSYLGRDIFFELEGQMIGGLFFFFGLVGQNSKLH